VGRFQYTRCRLTNPVEYRGHYVQTRRAFSDVKPAGKVVFLQLAADARKRQGAEAAGSGSCRERKRQGAGAEAAGSGSGRERKRKRQGAEAAGSGSVRERKRQGAEASGSGSGSGSGKERKRQGAEAAGSDAACRRSASRDAEAAPCGPRDPPSRDASRAEGPRDADSRGDRTPALIIHTARNRRRPSSAR